MRGLRPHHGRLCCLDLGSRPHSAIPTPTDRCLAGRGTVRKRNLPESRADSRGGLNRYQTAVVEFATGRVRGRLATIRRAGKREAESGRLRSAGETTAKAAEAVTGRGDVALLQQACRSHGWAARDGLCRAALFSPGHLVGDSVGPARRSKRKRTVSQAGYLPGCVPHVKVAFCGVVSCTRARTDGRGPGEPEPLSF